MTIDRRTCRLAVDSADPYRFDEYEGCCDKCHTNSHALDLKVVAAGVLTEVCCHARDAILINRSIDDSLIAGKPGFKENL